MKKIEVSKIIVKSVIDQYLGIDDNFNKHNLLVEMSEKMLKNDLVEMKSNTIEKLRGFLGEEMVETKMTAFFMSENEYVEALKLLHQIHNALPDDMHAISDKLHSLLLGDNELKV